LNLYGFKIADDNEKSQVFLKLISKHYPITPSNTDLSAIDTVDLFIKLNYDLSGIVTDKEWVEDFEENYRAFTKLHSIVQLDIRPE
jgi:hypothetical protein